MKKIVIIGAGSMGSAFTLPCVDNRNRTFLIGTHLEDKLINSLKKNYLHPLLKTKLPKKLTIEKFKNLDSIIKDADIIVGAVSSPGIDWFANVLLKNYKKKHKIILLTKGLSVSKGNIITLTDKIKKIFAINGIKNINISAIKGPCLAGELANRIRTGTVIANSNIQNAKYLQKIISTKYYSTEISNDIKGVELCGAIKNIYSMLIGASEGLSSANISHNNKKKYYNNTAASLIHRSISEMSNFVEKFGGKSKTVYGLAGLGDLYVSVIGGRNSQMGKYLGEGYLFKSAKKKFMNKITVEGAQLAKEIGPTIFRKLKRNKFPLMFNILNTICKNKKLNINW